MRNRFFLPCVFGLSQTKEAARTGRKDMRNKLSTALAVILALSAPAAMAQTSSSESSSSDSSGSSESGSTDTSTDSDSSTDSGSTNNNTGDGMEGDNTVVTEDDGDPEGDGAISEDATEDGVEDNQPGEVGDLTIEQQTQFRTAITEAQIEALALASIDFDLSAGVVVPETVTLQPLPESIVALVPAYEGYLFFVLDDGRIVVVNPDSLEIAFVIAAQ
jgi:hypothetical protein